LTIPNQNLFRIANEKTTFADAFKMADDVLYAGVRGVTDLMVQPGLINLDFSDVKTVMSEMGKAMMGTGEASGEGRAVAAAEAAIANPLIDDVSLKGAKGLIINITGGNDITLYEVDEAANRIKQEVDEDANIIYGTTCDERLEGVVRVSLVATGIDVNSEVSPKPLDAVGTLSIDNSVYLQKSSEINQNIKVIKEDIDKELTLENTEEDEIIDSNNEKALPSDNPDIDYTNIEVGEYTPGSLLTEKVNIKADQSLDDVEQIEESNELEKVDSHIHEENQVFSNSSVADEEVKPSVRRLSLFDTLEDKISESEPMQKSTSVKSEPIFQNEIPEEANEITNTEEDENEFLDDGGSDSEDDFNQETEEELLDIPTFLRRQAN
jgi:cell division protein FtsZ